MEDIRFKHGGKEYVIEFRASDVGNTHHSGWGKPKPDQHNTFLIHLYCKESPAFRIEGIWSRGCCIESGWDDVNIDTTELEKNILSEAERELFNYFKKLP